jgi:hypothetical protein
VTEPMNFAPRPSAAFAEAFQAHVDLAIVAKKGADDGAYRATSDVMGRPGIGAGRLGNDCHRAIAYEYHRTPKDPGREFSGRLYRIFDRGHTAEEKMASYLRLAGFKLLTENARGRQFRFDIAKYEDGKGRIKGMIDGVITDGPAFIVANGQHFMMKYPCVWENKELGSKGYKKIEKLGVRAYGGDYFPQSQMNMFHLDLTENPCLFTVKNADTQEIYAELVAFDPTATQAAIDVGVKVIQTQVPEEMPRVASSATDQRCKFCDFPARCWQEAKPAASDAPTTAWSFGKP